MIHSFTYKGRDSREFGLYITNKESYNKPSRNIDFKPVPGRNGAVIIDNGGYENLDVSLSVRLFVPQIATEWDNHDFAYAYNKVTEWICGDAGYYVYTDTYDPDYYRLGCIKSGIKVNQRRKDVADLTFSFSFKPYKYRLYSPKVTITESKAIQNPEQYDSLPLLRIYTDKTYNSAVETRHYFSINNKTYRIDNINSYVDIDCERMDAFKGATNMNKNYKSDNFPVLVAGRNTITPVQNVSKIDITPRWRAI